MKKIRVWHGTNKENALAILRNGFKPWTFFALHLEDALEFGGSWVFMVDTVLDERQGWELRNTKKIPPSSIKRLTQYRPIVRVGTQEHISRKIDSEVEHFNLLGKPLKSPRKNKKVPHA